MTDAEQIWTLKRELAQTKLALYEARSEILKLAHDAVRSELDALGDTWESPAATTGVEIGCK
jgi:hypothetical protein